MKTPALIEALIEKAMPLQTIYAKNGSQIRLVGGCVRDAIIGIISQDIDLATPLPPDQGMKVLKDNGITCIPTGIKHGTFTAILNNHLYEITTLRQDLFTDGRRAKVAFTDDWSIDASRRDLTINAVYADFTGKIYDYFDGIKDLQEGNIFFIGSAKARIREDYLRLLRFFRFHAWYGKHPLDKGTLQICRRLAANIQLLSKERVTKEFLSLLQANNPHPTLLQMAAYEVLGNLFQDNALSRLETLIKLEEKFSLPANPLRRLSVFYAKEELFQLSNIQKRYLKKLDELGHENLFDMVKCRYFLSLNNKEIIRDALLVKYSQQSSKEENFFIDLLREIEQLKTPPFPLNGNDLLKMNIKTGSQIGKMLDNCRSWWGENNYLPDKKDCLIWLENQYSSTL